MDATRLPAPAAEAPATVPSMPVAMGETNATQREQQAPIGGRFQLSGIGLQTATGLASDATDLTAGATVVVKLVDNAVLPTTAMADRALRELKQLGKVTSDRIVRVIDQGRAPDGRVYVATERVDAAMTLEELVGREGPLPLERAKAIVLSVGEALTEAQKVGVIHRDVAPRNVFIGPGDRVKVGDFGLAEAVSDRVFGAPAFLSPEQAEGKPVDQRSNIYSLGAIYYFALTGKAPFAGDAASLMQQHLSATPQPPSTLRPGLGSDVDRVILKALEKSGGRRHLTLRQLLTEVGGTSTTGPQQPVRAAADAKTVMGMEAPQIPVVAAQPQPSPPTVQPSPPAQPSPPVQPSPQPQPSASARGPAQTMMGIPPTSPVGAMGPGSTAPSMPVQPPPKAAPQAATVMAEAPQLPSKPQPAAPQAPMPTPQPMVPHAPPRAVTPQAATVMAEAPQLPVSHAAPAPATVAPSAPLGAKANNATGKKGAFRETAWFKRGELEEEMAKAQAAAGDNALKTGTTGKHLPVDESQVDLSAQDHARLSLKTGATQAMPVIKGVGTGSVQALPGERMDEEEMLAELNPSRKYFLIAGAVVVLAILAAVAYFATRSSPKAEAPTPEKPAAVAASPPAAVPAPTPPAAPTTPAPPPTTTKPAAPATPAPAAVASPSLYAARVAKLETSGDKKEAKRLEKLVALELKTAHKKSEKELEAADRELLQRIKKVVRGK
jgi:serine/threonine protein kinase